MDLVILPKSIERNADNLNCGRRVDMFADEDDDTDDSDDSDDTDGDGDEDDIKERVRVERKMFPDRDKDYQEYDDDDDDDDDTFNFYPKGDQMLNLFKRFNERFKDAGHRALRESLNINFKSLKSQRFVIVIDRRHRRRCGSGGDTCFIYQLPAAIHKIHSNHLFLNFVAVTANFLVPDMIAKGSGPRYKGARFDNFAETFVISFQCLTPSNIRMQWFFGGGGIRFHPRYMFNVWPQMFKYMNRIDGSKYNEEWLTKRWVLNTEDITFEQWYASLAPTW